ncbi:MAG: aspartate carbamoyltransferase catalytic subunit [Gemmatimonadetes bacterium]|nr:aspartate carbamoyltransferase catalytic subunit [Gemmatimonadota bacterium]
MRFAHKDLLGLEDLTRGEITAVLDTSEPFKEISERRIKKVPVLRGKTIVNLFYEPSTRTRVSFEFAEKRLSADTVNISTTMSSIAKGETLVDTARNLEAMRIDMVVIRHGASGAPRFLAERIPSNVINAGDGSHEHPTQGLLDLLTIRDFLGRIEGVRVVLVGDILHSRVARSNIWGLLKLGAEVGVCGPPSLIPPEIEGLGVRVYRHVEDAIAEADVLNVLRIQLERQKANLFPSLREYNRIFGISNARLSRAPRDILILHPGPMNRGVEIDSDVADGEHAVILDQVTNGVAVRMAVLYLLAGFDVTRAREAKEGLEFEPEAARGSAKGSGTPRPSRQPGPAGGAAEARAGERGRDTAAKGGDRGEVGSGAELEEART